MKITRQTKLYKSQTDTDVFVTFRTLNISELKVIDSIKSQFHKAEIAFELGYISGDNPNYLIKEQIGRDIIEASSIAMDDEVLFELIVEDFRTAVNNDMMFDLCARILEAIPSTTIEYLMSCTFNDLIELVAFVEKLTNKKIFKFEKKQDINIKDEKAFFQEDGKTLQDKMKEMDKF